MNRLREKDINKLSAITQIPGQSLELLSSMKLLDVPTSTDLLILNDWKALKKTKQYTTSQIIQALISEYNVSKSKVQSAIYKKKTMVHYCDECGKRIPKSEHVRNNGKCDLCVAKSIRL